MQDFKSRSELEALDSNLTPDRYRHVKKLFLAACELESGDRTSYLEQACPDDPVLREQIEVLLAHDAARTGFLRTVPHERKPQATTPHHGSSAGPSDLPSDRLQNDLNSQAAPQRIGGYVIRGLLGEGGMGVVYLAEQEKPRRAVALKVIKSGLVTPASIRRFEHEAQVLARLQHPGIAQIFAFETGIGDADDRPSGIGGFFAMELIHGRPLLDYAREQKLDTPRRLMLLMQICEAVQHAHQRGVIHRDLKPANILVDASGQTKILDFGVARVTDSDLQTASLRTDIGQLVGTLPYMSPEQAEGVPHEVDSRSDVYALGVIGYELLSGRLPYDTRCGGIPEALRVIREEEPIPLSAVNRSFRGDLQTILAKALEKEKGRRYPSAAELAADVARYLRDQPIQARPASAVYQLRKFTRRNKTLVAGMGGVFLTLFAGVVGTGWQAWRATRERDRAENQAAKARRVVEFVQNMLGAAEPSVARGKDLTIRTLLDEAAEKVRRELEREPETGAAISMTIGNTYSGLGLYEQAEGHLRRSLAAREALFGAEHIEVAASQYSLASLLRAKGEPVEAEPLFIMALQTARKLAGPESQEVADILNGLGTVQRDKNEYASAEESLREALRIYRRLFGNEAQRVAMALGNVALVLHDRGDFVSAEPLFVAALAMRRRVLGPDHREVASNLNNLALLRRDRGDLEGAESASWEAVAIERKVFDDGHPELGLSLSTLALVLQDKGDHAAAIPVLQEAITVQSKTFSDDHADVARLHSNLAASFYHMKRNDEAEVHGQAALAVLRRRPDAEGLVLVNCLNVMSYVLRTKGDLGTAESYCREALDLRRRLQPGHPDVADSLVSLGRILMAENDHAGAEGALHECMAIRQSALPPGHWQIGNTGSVLGSCLTSLERWEEAESLLIGSQQLLEAVLGEDHHRTIDACSRIRDLYMAWGKQELAEAYRGLPADLPDSSPAYSLAK